VILPLQHLFRGCVKRVSATIQIGAPPQAVWAALTDLGRYPEWNPLFCEASGQVAVGNRITLRTVHPAYGRLMTVKPTITVADPGAELRWVSSLPGIISAAMAMPPWPCRRWTGTASMMAAEIADLNRRVLDRRDRRYHALLQLS
jgi:Polyketide cyclase / dehydrase and lipid transport